MMNTVLMIHSVFVATSISAITDDRHIFLETTIIAEIQDDDSTGNHSMISIKYEKKDNKDS